MIAVGWNWRNSRSASCAPARWASTMPAPVEPGGFVVRLHSAAAPPAAMTLPRARIARPSSSRTPTQRRRRRTTGRRPWSPRGPDCGSSTASPARSRTTLRPVALPPACTTRRLPCRPRGRARGCRGGRRRSARRAPRACGPRGRVVDEDLGGRAPGQAAAGLLGVGEVVRRGVVDGERRGDAALRPVAGGLGQRRRGDERDGRALARRAQGGEEAGGAGADDGDVGSKAVRHGGVPYRRPAGRPVHASVVAGARHRRAPRARGAHPRDRRALESRDWLGWSRV